MSKKIIAIIISIAIVGGGSFYAGMKYSQSKNSTIGRGGFANLSPEERQARFQQFGVNGAGRQGGMRANGGFIGGEIISKDDKSITVKLNDGGSKIILFSTSTQIIKSSAAAAKDLKIGQNITANGDVNQDGSVSAKLIQLRSNFQQPK